jgi:predicted TPR repeat methyltransferase
MDAIVLSSGDLVADRRFEWARDLEAKGDLAGAAGLLTQALELAPGYASAWFALGELREKLGDRAGAAAAYEKARTADPQDRHGASLHLMRLGARPAAAMPEGYVRALFDGYAPSFDQALRQGLGYCGPELLHGAIEATGRPLKFGSLLDLGCGTGLGGEVFRPFCDWLVGVDLSRVMLSKAREKGLYDRLAEADVRGFLDGEAAAQTRYHFILAADLFMYLDDLVPVMTAAAKILAPSGLLAFNVETHDGDGAILRDTLRYAHGAANVRAGLDAAGLTPVSLDSAVCRTEKGTPVPGLICVAQN